jgi:hypothetical protein
VLVSCNPWGLLMLYKQETRDRLGVDCLGHKLEFPKYDGTGDPLP